MMVALEVSQEMIGIFGSIDTKYGSGPQMAATCVFMDDSAFQLW